jgi:CheY-like chemotaxis protein
VARVLVADDNADTRDALALILRAAGHEVIGAADGEEAVDLYRAQSFDLLVLDLLMPKRDGFETLRILKGEFPGMRALVISGAWRVGGRDALGYARELGATVAMLKPAEPAVVLRAVGELLALSS